MLNTSNNNVPERLSGRYNKPCHVHLYNLYFKRVTPITTKSILPSGPLKTKLIIIKLQQSWQKVNLQIVIIIEDLTNSRDLKN